jgi:hypothetical protein
LLVPLQQVLQLRLRSSVDCVAASATSHWCPFGCCRRLAPRFAASTVTEFYSSAALAADFAVTAAAGELAITFRINFAFFSFEGEEEVVKKEVVWCSYRLTI